jgi:hypothetical protein
MVLGALYKTTYWSLYMITYLPRALTPTIARYYRTSTRQARHATCSENRLAAVPRPIVPVIRCKSIVFGR